MPRRQAHTEAGRRLYAARRRERWWTAALFAHLAVVVALVALGLSLAAGVVAVAGAAVVLAQRSIDRLTALGWVLFAGAVVLAGGGHLVAAWCVAAASVALTVVHRARR